MSVFDLPDHPLASLMPPMGEKEYADFRDNIAQQGYDPEQPVVTYQGTLLDGRHRRRACQELGIDCPAKEYTGDDPLGFVLGRNLHRRHLDESQRALVAAKIANLRQGSNQHEARGPANLPDQPVTQQRAAELLNVSERLVRDAKRVIEQAPEEVAAIERGERSVSAAVKELAGRRAAAGSEETEETAPPDEPAVVVARGEREILAEAKQIRQRRQEERRADRLARLGELAAAPFPDGATRYPVLLADPPWRYQHSESESRAVEGKYPTMALEEICALPVADLATPAAVLFLWATAPKLEEAMQVIRAWGFTYRTNAVWDKEKLGMGYWWRQQHELLLTATRGDMPAPPPGGRCPSVLRAPRGKHSAKPKVARERIEAMYPGMPKIELFARGRPREGWTVWGNEVLPLSADAPTPSSPTTPNLFRELAV